MMISGSLKTTLPPHLVSRLPIADTGITWGEGLQFLHDDESITVITEISDTDKLLKLVK